MAMKRPTCGTCAALQFLPGPDGAMKHLCQRHPPQVSVFYLPQMIPAASNDKLIKRPGGATPAPATVSVQSTVNAFWPALDPKNDSHGCYDWIAKDDDGPTA